MEQTPAPAAIAPPAAPEIGALWRHRAAVVTAVYAFIALVGALYHVQLLGDFGLNPFHYWEASDFLLATFRAPLSIAFGLIAVYLYFVMTQPLVVNDAFYGRIPWLRRLVRYDRWRESRWMAPRVGPVTSLVVAVLWFVVVMGGLATEVAVAARTGKGEPVRWAVGDAPLREAQLLATTNRFVFLVEPGAKPSQARILTVPIDALTMLEQCGARRGPLRRLVRGAERCDEVVAPAPAPVAAPAPAAHDAAAAPATAAP